MNAPRPNRIRIRFSKYGPIRFTSHRDVARVWERALRRTGIPVAYSEGFSPRPRLRFGLALATAHESCGEYLDIDLQPETEVDLDGLPALLGPVLPNGMDVQATAPVVPGSPSLQEAVVSCSWYIELLDFDRAAGAALVDHVLTAEELPVTRTRKGTAVTDDIRADVLDLRIVDNDVLPPAADWQPAGVLLEAELASQGRTCRPSELLRSFDDTLDEGRVIRVHQWTQVDGLREEPLPLEQPLPTTSPAAHAVRCAS